MGVYVGVYRQDSGRRVAAYLLRVTATTAPQEAFRTVRWCDPPAAARCLAEDRADARARELVWVLDAAVRQLGG